MDDTAESVADVAERFFREGHNCAQAVLRAVAEAHGVSCPQCIPAVALGMGGGVGHTGHSCGAVTGGVMALGLAMDRALAGTIIERKRAAYGVAGRFVKDFIAEFGSADCCDILGFDWSDPGAADRFLREEAMCFKCTPCVRWAADESSRVIGALAPRPSPQGA